jgi:hypothetical protein
MKHAAVILVKQTAPHQTPPDGRRLHLSPRAAVPNHWLPDARGQVLPAGHRVPWAVEMWTTEQTRCPHSHSPDDDGYI